jgi:hypothetical protein
MNSFIRDLYSTVSVYAGLSNSGRHLSTLLGKSSHLGAERNGGVYVLFAPRETGGDVHFHAASLGL